MWFVSVLGKASAFDLLRVGVPPNPPVTVPKVDLNKYMGVWYEQAVIPYFFERDCTNTKATYSIDSKGVRVDNYCLRNGKAEESIGRATPEDDTNSKLAVRFYPLAPPGQYWIVRLDDDYTYVAISDPHYDFLWILSRNTTMNETLFNSVVKSLAKDGFPVEKLVRTKQNAQVNGPPVTVPKVDLNKFMGDWYEQAVIPYGGQRGCINTKATYTLLSGYVKFDNSCFKNGRLVVVSGKGTPEDETNAKMVLRFPFTPPEQYWVVRLDAEYSYVAICDGNYNGLWIMSRGKTMDEAVYASLVKSLASDGFPVDKLVRTTQNIQLQ